VYQEKSLFDNLKG